MILKILVRLVGLILGSSRWSSQINHANGHWYTSTLHRSRLTRRLIAPIRNDTGLRVLLVRSKACYFLDRVHLDQGRSNAHDSPILRGYLRPAKRFMICNSIAGTPLCLCEHDVS